jgi:PhnB protein
MTISPYLFFKGNCEEAMKFYAQVIGAEIDMMMRHTGTPMEEHVPAAWKEKIMHASIKLGDNWLMASDAPPDFQSDFGGFSVSYEVKTPEEAERVYNALLEGGTATMPMAETFWAHRFGMLRDKFGVPWIIGCSKPM